MVVGLFSELLSAGGIQVVGRHAAAVLAALARERGWSYRFLGLNDPVGGHEVQVGDLSFRFQGFSRAKGEFLVAALKLARRGALVVVAAHPHLAPLAWAMKELSHRIRVVVMTHGIEVWTALSSIRRLALRRGDWVLAPSTDTARKVVSVQGVHERKVRWLPWGLDPDFLTLSTTPETLPLPQGFPKGRVVLSVGRCVANERYKGIDHLISSVPQLLKNAPDLYMVIVGDGDDRVRLEELARGLGIAERVSFLGKLSGKELVACYAHADVFALPSGGEGFGLVFLEAMALGKPVVGGALGGTPDLIEDGLTGFLVRPGDTGQLVAALNRLLSDVSLRQDMGRLAKSRAHSLYRFENFRAGLNRVLQETGLVECL